jgi:hypothetical protein
MPPRLVLTASLALAAAAGAGLVSGCGHGVRVASGGTLQIGLTEYAIRPAQATAGQGLLTIVAHNYGVLTHNLTVARDSEQFGSTPPIPPGQSATLTLDLAPGTYTLTSTILSDQALGARGTLDVAR